MKQSIDNELQDCNLNDYIGGNQTNNFYISMFREEEREFVVTHNASIKPVSYFIGRETELQELRQKIEKGQKSLLISGISGIGKTEICRKLFQDYLIKYNQGEKRPFQHIGYIEYSGNMGNSLQNCLKYKRQADQESNQEAAWIELEYLASSGRLLLFVDNVDKSKEEDLSLERLDSIPGMIVIVSRQASFDNEFETYRIGSFDIEQCKDIYEKIRFGGSGGKVGPEEIQDLECVIESLAMRNTVAVELFAHRARTKLWSVKRLREDLEHKGFRLEFCGNKELINIQKINADVTIFLSYNWHDKDIADMLDKDLSTLPINLKRDIRGIGPWENVQKFMKNIRQEDYAVLVISDSYLRSEKCMLEVTEIMKEPKYESRLFLAVAEKRIYDPLIRVKYIKYWQDECNKLEAAIKELAPIYAVEPIVDLKRYQSIAVSIGKFLRMVADRNNPDIGEMAKEIAKVIFKYG